MTRRFTPEVALSYPVVSDPQLTPDGELVAFVIAAATRPSGPDRPAFPPSAIHVVPAGGGPTVRFTQGRADTTPRWSPDGARLAFLSDRAEDGRRQVHVLPRHGGDARQLTRVEGTIPVTRTLLPLSWLPDGRSLSFLMVDGTSPDVAAREAAGDDRIVVEEDPRWQRLWTADAESGALTCVSPAGVQVWEYALSPDGRQAAAIVSDHPYEWDWYRARVAVFDLGGAATRIVHASRRQVGKPVWSDDGRFIAFQSSVLSDRGFDNGDVFVVPADGSAEARDVTEDHGVSDVSVRFLSDGRLMMTTNVAAGSGIAVVDPATCHRTWLWNERAGIGSLSLVTRPDGRSVYAAVIDTVDTPPELMVGMEAGPQHAIEWRPVTRLHEAFSDVVVGPTREVSWVGRDGLALQGFLHLPPGVEGAGPLPLVVLVHGGPTGAVRCEFQYGQRWARVLADAGLAVFAPNYRGSTGWGLDFAESNVGDMGGEDWWDIQTGIDRLIADGIADSGRLAICGWSYGGFMTSWAITQTDRFRAAMSGAGIVDWRSFHGRSYLHTWDRLHYGDVDPYDPSGPHTRFSPWSHIHHARTPTLILHGQEDGDVPVEQGHQLHRALTDLGIETQLVVYPREPHGPTEHAHRLDILERLRDWFVTRLAD